MVLTEDTIRTKRIELVDDGGEIRALLDADPSGSGAVGINLFDSGGNPRVSLAIAEDDTPTFSLHDESGTLRVWISSGPDGQGIRMCDDKGAPRLQLQLDQSGGADLLMLDQSGANRVVVSQMGDRGGAPILLFKDENGKDRLQLQVGPESISTIRFNGEDGQLQVALGRDPDGESLFVYRDENGEQKRAF
jgi:hypothetical protein